MDFQELVDLTVFSMRNTNPITNDLIEDNINKFLTIYPDLVPDKEKLIKTVQNKLNIVITNTSVIMEDLDDHIPWLPNRRASIEWAFWNQYKKYLVYKNWPKPVIDNIDEISDDILSKIENPFRVGKWDKRGLVVGNVQSGKTANFISLIAKSLDAGFKIIIILAGIHNSLRCQTQIRIDESILGFDSQRMNYQDREQTTYIGVGNLPDYKQSKIISLTNSNERGDFRISFARQINYNPTQLQTILVIKKNNTVLKNFLKWISGFGMRNEQGFKEIPNTPILIIDDEADNASINTAKNEKDSDEYNVSAINGTIRKILTTFSQSVYIGYTATPFANIFIEDKEIPNSGNLGLDLFPKNFIISLPIPSNYISPAKVFGLNYNDNSDNESTEGLPILEVINDYGDYIPEKHKKDLIVDDLPSSLKEAIKSFIITITIRKIRRQETHNSMLIHVTRFIKVQKRIFSLVSDEIKKMSNYLSSQDPNGSDNIYSDFFEIFSNFRSKSESIRNSDLIEDNLIDDYLWEDIKWKLKDVPPMIETKLINGSSKDILDYKELNQNNLSLNAIFIGGDKLSRGLTLEGLSISYYLRASKMYDTLMQMGRWFGYRDGYIDLCRIYTSSELITWYEFITIASEELKEEFEYMASVGLTPKDFGLKVLKHPDNLLITSANKMRNGTKVEINFSDTISETIIFDRDEEIIKKNFQAFENFINSFDRSKVIEQDNYYKWTNIEGERIVGLLDSVTTHKDSKKAIASYLNKFISDQIHIGELVNWTVALIKTGNSDNKSKFAGFDIELVKRAEFTEAFDEKAYKIKRLVSPIDEYIDLSKEDLQEALLDTIEKYKIKNPDFTEKKLPKRPSGNLARKKRNKSNGLLIIYPLDTNPAISKDYFLIGFAISFPYSETSISHLFVVNNIYYEQEFEEDLLGNDL